MHPDNTLEICTRVTRRCWYMADGAGVAKLARLLAEYVGALLWPIALPLHLSGMAEQDQDRVRETLRDTLRWSRERIFDMVAFSMPASLAGRRKAISIVADMLARVVDELPVD